MNGVLLGKDRLCLDLNRDLIPTSIILVLAYYVTLPGLQPTLSGPYVGDF